MIAKMEVYEKQTFSDLGPKGHRPVIVKRAVIGSKGGWKPSTIFLSCKVFQDWSVIKLRKYIVFIRWVYLSCTF